MTPPDFIIAGAMRSGTTALAEALGQHPAVFVTEPKEPSYFTYRHGGADFNGPGDQWFARQNVGDWSGYQSLFRTARAQIRGEASAMYLAVPDCLPDIASSCPEARIVLVLRDPVQRAFSAWLYLRSQGRERLSDVEAALDAEAERRASGYGPMWWLTGASRYDVGLARLYETFPADRIRVVLTEELRADPETVVRDTCAFLGVPSSDAVTAALGNEVNRGGEPRSRGITRVLYPPDRLRRALSGVAPSRVREAVRTLRRSSLVDAPTMSPSIRERLREQLRDVGPRVAELSGADTGRFWPDA